MLWRGAGCASIGVAVAIDKVSTVMSVFMLSLLSGPFEAAGRLPQLKIKRWAVGTTKLPFRKLNSNLREQVGRAAGAVIGACSVRKFGWAAPVGYYPLWGGWADDVMPR